MKSIRFVFVVLLYVILQFTVLATDNDYTRPQQRYYSKPDTPIQYKIVPIPPELDAWVVKNVVPEIQSWKKEFDSKLSKKDLLKLNAIREQARLLDSAFRLPQLYPSRQNKEAYLWANNKQDSLQQVFRALSNQLSEITLSKRNSKLFATIFYKARFWYSIWGEQLNTQFRKYIELHPDNTLTYEDVKESIIDKYKPFGLRSRVTGGYFGEVFLGSNNLYFWDGTYPTLQK
ncbi:MAG: hypothetical protein U0Y96_04400 [Candidatus Kapaibacterium sp.]